MYLPVVCNSNWREGAGYLLSFTLTTGAVSNTSFLSLCGGPEGKATRDHEPHLSK